MIRPSLIDKLKSLIDLISSSAFFVILLLVFIGLSIYLYRAINENNQKAKKKCIIGYGIFLVIISIIYHEFLGNILNTFIDKFFMAFCFPSIFLYIGILIVVNLIFFKTVFKKELPKFQKAVHIFVYFFMHFLSILLLQFILKENIDVSTEVTMYMNTTVLNVVGLGITVFIAWILFLTAIKVIAKLTANIKEEPVKQYKYIDGRVEIPSTVHIEVPQYEEEKENSIPTYSPNATIIEPKEEKMPAFNFENMSLNECKNLRNMLTGLAKEEQKGKTY